MNMKKLVLLLCLALSLVLATAGLADEVPAGLIGEWEMTGMVGDGQVDADEFDSSMTFTETELTMTVTMYGETQSMTLPYTIEGTAIVANGVPMEFVLDGDTLTMMDGYVSGGITMDLVFTRKGAAPAAAANDASVLLGEWKLLGPADDETAAQMPEDYEASFVFTETEIISTVILNGEDISQSAEYTVEGNTIFSDVSEMTWEINGNELILTEYGVSLRFERVSTGIVGEWNVVELIGAGSDEATQGIEMIKALGGSIQFIFTETEMTLRMSFMGENMDETTPYTIVGNEIVSNGEGVPYVLEGDRLTISDGETGFVLVRAGAEPEAAEVVETPSKTGVTSPIGEWTLVAMTGNEEIEQSWQIVKAVGGSITLTVTETTATMNMSIMGETETETMDCTVNGNVVTMEDDSTAVLENDQLIMTQDGMSMIFEQK